MSGDIELYWRDTQGNDRSHGLRVTGYGDFKPSGERRDESGKVIWYEERYKSIAFELTEEVAKSEWVRVSVAGHTSSYVYPQQVSPDGMKAFLYCGDANEDGAIDISDVARIFRFSSLSEDSHEQFMKVIHDFELSQLFTETVGDFNGNGMKDEEDIAWTLENIGHKNAILKQP